MTIGLSGMGFNGAQLNPPWPVMFNVENSNYDQLSFWHREHNNIFCGKLNPTPVLRELNPAPGWPGPLNTTPRPGPLNTAPGQDHWIMPQDRTIQYHPRAIESTLSRSKDQMYGLLFDFDIFCDKTTMWANLKDNFPIQKWFLFL